jgi:hypothetical protein
MVHKPITTGTFLVSSCSKCSLEMGETLLRTFQKNEIQVLRAVRGFQATTVNFSRKPRINWWYRLHNYTDLCDDVCGWKSAEEEEEEEEEGKKKKQCKSSLM